MKRQEAHGEDTAPVAADFLAVGASGAQAFMVHRWRKLQGLPEADEKVFYKFTAPYFNRALVVFLAGCAIGLLLLNPVIASALSGIPVRRDLAMTGEITLRGKVLPIGGLKEKLLAAHRAGLFEVLLPKDNEKDLPDVPENLRKAMKLQFVDAMDQVLKLALERPLPEIGVAGDQTMAPIPPEPPSTTAHQ